MQLPRWLVRVQTWQNLAAAQNAPGYDEMTTVWTVVSLRASVSGVLTLRLSWWAHDSGIHSAYRHSFGRCFGFFGSPCTCKTTQVIIAHSAIHTWLHNDRTGKKEAKTTKVIKCSKITRQTSTRASPSTKYMIQTAVLNATLEEANHIICVEQRTRETKKVVQSVVLHQRNYLRNILR